MSKASLSIKIGDWQSLQTHAAPIRITVFVDEQNVPIELEWDDLDPKCEHAVAFDASGMAIGTARLDPDGHIGRMAVLKAYRDQGVGTALLKSLIDRARKNRIKWLALNAQTHALPFYTRLGFTAIGDVFDDAGIPHRRMFLDLS